MITEKRDTPQNTSRLVLAARPNNTTMVVDHSGSNNSPDTKFNNGRVKNHETIDLKIKSETLDRYDKKLDAIENGSFPPGKEVADFEQAIELTGYGKFHYLLLVVCGFVSTSEEMDVICMSFILPSAQCDLKLNTTSKGWLNSIIFIGMMAGAYIWGSLADSLGRRKVLIVISFMNALCIVASTFAQSYGVFMFFRFLNGAALGGSGPVIWSYFAEFQPKNKRGSMLSSMAAFWTLGNLFVASLAWIIIPLDIGFKSPAFLYNSWRIFLAICSIPSVLVAVFLFFLPESPKFLLTCNDHQKALEVFKQIYAINTGNDPDMYPVKSLLSKSNAIEHDTKKSKSLKTMTAEVANNTKKIFLPPILKYTWISIVINLSFHIGYYGLMMWFPELFNRFDEFARAHNNSEQALVCEVTEFVVKTGSHSHIDLCSDKIESGVFLESFITVAAAIPSNVFAVLGMDTLGRKFFLVFSTMTSGICAVGLSLITSKRQNLIVSAIFSSAISCGNAALDCLITEIFPTNLRATGMAISMVAARLGGIIGNIVIAALLDLYCPLPTYIVAVLLIGGGLLCLMLPNTTREPLT